MFCKTRKSLFLATITILASITIYNIYGASNVFAATASLSTTGSVNIDVSASGNSANVGSDTLTVNTTCSTGYTVTIQSSTNDAILYKDGDSANTSPSSKIIPTMGTNANPLPIIGEDGSGNSYLGTWGYSMTNNLATGTFIGLTSTPTIIKQSTTASATGGDQFPVYYGVSVTPDLEVGQYTMAKDNNNNPGTIVYQLTMPVECQTYSISYDGNNADPGTTMSVMNGDLNLNDETTLMPSNYKKAGYGFAGWNTKADGTGTDFGPMETVTLSTSDTKGNALIQSANQYKEITLYAKWIQAEQNVTMQTWSGCNSMTSGQVIALTDTRDNNTYAIAKLADDKCWMIENLRLGGSSSMSLTTANTAISSNITLPASTNTFTTSNYTSIEMNATNTVSPVTDMSALDADTAVYSYGNYYSYAAAIGTTAANNTNNNSATTSICPTGWHLPKGGDKNNEANNEFWNLIVTKLNNEVNPANYNSGTTQPYYTGDPEGRDVAKLIRVYPNNFIYSGYMLGPSLSGRSTYADVWSSTVNSSTNAYVLASTSSVIRPGAAGWYKYGGLSVRCVAGEDVTIEKAYARAGKTKVTVGGQSYYKMQDMNDSICGAVNVLDEPGQTQLVDIRDNKIYWATKLQDGKCWMTQNLDLNLSTSTTLTSADTDLNSKTSWRPARSTINAVTNENTAGTITGFAVDNNSPYSIDTGNYYWKNTPFYNAALCNVGSDYNTCDYLTKPDDTWKNYFSTTPYTANGTHGHVGNLYNWSALVASNDTSNYTSSTFANISNSPQDSICPKGWRLPTISNASYTINGTNEFARVANLYANYSGDELISSEGLEKAPLYWVRAGYAQLVSSRPNQILYSPGYNAMLGSSTVNNSTMFYGAGWGSTRVVTSYSDYSRARGTSVRCVNR